MSISTYAELKAAVAAWPHRTDLTASIPDFILLAEKLFNRRLRVRQMEESLPATTISGTNTITIPAGTLAVKNLWPVGYENVLLQPQTLEAVVARKRTTGTPTMFAWQASTWLFDGSGDVAGTYYEEIPALSDSNTTNWLLTASPDLYLFASLAEAAFYVKDESRAGMWTERTSALIKELNGNSDRDTMGGPLVARAR